MSLQDLINGIVMVMNVNTLWLKMKLVDTSHNIMMKFMLSKMFLLMI